MKNFFKKPLSVVLAVAIILVSVGIGLVVFAQPDYLGTVTTTSKFYIENSGDGLYDDADSLADGVVGAHAGDLVRADFHMTTDFMVGAFSLYLIFNDEVLEFDTALNNIRPGDITIDGNQYWGEEYGTPCNTSYIVNNGASLFAADGYPEAVDMGRIFVRSTRYGLAMHYNDENLFSIYFKAKADVTLDEVGTLRICPGTEASPTNPDYPTLFAFIHDPAISEGTKIEDVPPTSWDTSDLDTVGLTYHHNTNEIIFSNTITFNLQGGNIAGSTDDVVVTGEFETVIPTDEIPADPVRDGYEFVGWSSVLYTGPTEQEVGGVRYAGGDYNELLSDAEVAALTFGTLPQILYAVYSRNMITVDFMAGENDDVEVYTLNNGYTPVDTSSEAFQDIIPTTEEVLAALQAANDPDYNTYKEGYSFNWNTYPALITEPTTITGTWARNSYTITFDMNGADSAQIDPITQEYGTAVTQPADPTREGYDFTGWSPNVPTTMPAENMTVVAQWGINSYTITFDSAGGSAVDPITQEYGTTVTPPTPPTREGYDFTGWEPDLPGTMPAENMTVVAQWQAKQYTITFDMNGADSAQIDPITQDYGTTVTPPADPTRDGYDFTGWSPNLPNTMPANNMTVVAQWGPKQYTITFDSAGGSAVAPITAEFGATVTPPTPPTREGYDFTGWDPDLPDTMPANDMTVVAQWQIKQYTVTFVAGEHGSLDGGSPQTITVNHGTVLDATQIPDFTPDLGYVFDGWNPAITTPITSDITFTAQFELMSCTVTFFAGANGSLVGGSPQEITVPYGTELDATQIPGTTPDTGYEFAGWDGNVTLPIVDDMMFTAQFELGEYTITFDMNGADSAQIDPITQEYNTAVTPPADPTRFGYTFNGWNPGLPTVMPANDMTVVAQWTPVDFTVTFDANGGTPEPGDQTVPFNATVTEPTDPEFAGMTFLGWFIGSSDTLFDFSRTIEENGITAAEAPGNTLTLTAQFAVVHTYMANMLQPNGTFAWVTYRTFNRDVDPEPYEVPALPEVEGTTFEGWFADQACTIPVTPDGMYNDVSRTYYANSTLNEWTATFYEEDGTTIIEQTDYLYGQPVTRPADPTKPADEDGEYVFMGWVPTDATTPDIDELTTMPNNDVNYRATFELRGIEHMVSYFLDDGTLYRRYTEVRKGDPVPVPEAPEKFGYVFTGWEPAVPATMGDEDLEFTATFEIDKNLIYAVVGGTVIAGSVVAGIAAANTALITGAAVVGGGALIVGGIILADKTHKVTYLVDGEVYKVYYILEGQPIKVPKDPTKDGYEFAGWDKEIPEKMGKEDLTFNATWASEDVGIIPDTGSAVAGLTAFAAISSAAAAAYVMSRRKKED